MKSKITSMVMGMIALATTLTALQSVAVASQQAVQSAVAAKSTAAAQSSGLSAFFAPLIAMIEKDANEIEAEEGALGDVKKNPAPSPSPSGGTWGPTLEKMWPK